MGIFSVDVFDLSDFDGDVAKIKEAYQKEELKLLALKDDLNRVKRLPDFTNNEEYSRWKNEFWSYYANVIATLPQNMVMKLFVASFEHLGMTAELQEGVLNKKIAGWDEFAEKMNKQLQAHS